MKTFSEDSNRGEYFTYMTDSRHKQTAMEELKEESQSRI